MTTKQYKAYKKLVKRYVKRHPWTKEHYKEQLRGLKECLH